MRSFLDVEGRDWTIDLNIASARPLATWCKEQEPTVNLFDAASFTAAASDIIWAVDALSVLTAEQRSQRNVTPADFGRALKGGTAYEAQRTLMAEYADFFPDPAIAGMIKSSLDRLSESSKREQKLVEKAMELTIRAYDERIRIMDETLNGGLDSLPEPPAEGDSEQIIGF